MIPAETDELHESEFHDTGSRSDDDDLATRDDALEAARIEDFRHEALQNPNSLAACVGAATSRLMAAEKHFARDVLELLANGKVKPHNIPELPGAMQAWMSLSRQSGRNAQLFDRLTETKDAKSPNPRCQPTDKGSQKRSLGR